MSKKKWYEFWRRGERSERGAVPVVVRGEDLSEHGQRPIVMAVMGSSEEEALAIQAALESFVETVARFAREGQVVDAGDITEFGPSGFLRPQIRGVFYCETFGAFDEVPRGALLGVPIHEDELALMQSTSPYRVISRLGARAHSYPVPLFAELDRPSVVHPDDQEETLLGKMPRVMAMNISASRAGDTLRVHAARSVSTWIGEVYDTLGSSTAFALITAPSRFADARLVWEPGQDAPAAITGLRDPTADAARAMAGNALVVTPNDEPRSTTRLFEDGFALLLNRADASALEQALRERRPLDLQMDGMNLNLTWSAGGDGLRVRETIAHDPDDDRILVLLREQDAFARGVHMGALVDYIDALRAASLNDQTIRVRLEPGRGAEVEGIDEGATQALGVTPPTVTETLEFALGPEDAFDDLSATHESYEPE